MNDPLLSYSLVASPLTGSGTNNGTNGPKKLALTVEPGESGAEQPVACEAIMIAVPIGVSAHDLTDHPETIKMNQAGGLEPRQGGGWLPQAQMNSASTYMIYTWKPQFQTGLLDTTWELCLELNHIRVNLDVGAVEIFIAEDTTAQPSGGEATYKVTRGDLQTATFHPSDMLSVFQPLP